MRQHSQRAGNLHGGVYLLHQPHTQLPVPQGTGAQVTNPPPEGQYAGDTVDTSLPEARKSLRIHPTRKMGSTDLWGRLEDKQADPREPT